jgi:hypothetical protein
VAIAAGRCPVTAEGLLSVADLIDRLRSHPGSGMASSAVVGSSAISSFGSHASAIAIITRWRSPPESWCG